MAAALKICLVEIGLSSLSRLVLGALGAVVAVGAGIATAGGLARVLARDTHLFSLILPLMFCVMVLTVIIYGLIIRLICTKGVPLVVNFFFGGKRHYLFNSTTPFVPFLVDKKDAIELKRQLNPGEWPWAFDLKRLMDDVKHHRYANLTPAERAAAQEFLNDMRSDLPRKMDVLVQAMYDLHHRTPYKPQRLNSVVRRALNRYYDFFTSMDSYKEYLPQYTNWYELRDWYKEQPKDFRTQVFAEFCDIVEDMCLLNWLPWGGKIHVGSLIQHIGWPDEFTVVKAAIKRVTERERLRPPVSPDMPPERIYEIDSDKFHMSDDPAYNPVQPRPVRRAIVIHSGEAPPQKPRLGPLFTSWEDVMVYKKEIFIGFLLFCLLVYIRAKYEAWLDREYEKKYGKPRPKPKEIDVPRLAPPSSWDNEDDQWGKPPTSKL